MRFPGYDVDGGIDAVDPERALFTEPRLVRDVRGAFRRLRLHGEPLAVFDGGLIPDFRYTRVNIGNKGRARNHFQGIQRLRDGRHFVLSGGDLNQPASHVFIGRLASCPADGAWGCNLVLSREPSLGDSVVRTLAFDRTLWHAGGLALLGDVLAVPIEGDTDSRIVFLDLADPERPARIDASIERTNRKAGAVALTRFDDGRFVCAVWWEAGKTLRGRIDFYVSRTDDLRAGFAPQPAEWRFADAVNRGDRDPAYQCINFLHEAGGRRYLIGTENGSGKAPIFAGPDIADLFEVHFPDRFGEDAGVPPEVRRIDTRRFFCRDEFGNFDAAAGAHVDGCGALHLYTAYHWRLDDEIRLTEFSEEPEAAAAVDVMHRAWIELYEHDGFRGRRLTIRGLRLSRIENYGRIFVDGSGFDDRISSVRFQIPSGRVYRLFREPEFRGSEPGRDFVDLNGAGELVEVRNLADGLRFNDRVSSSCYV